MQGPKTSGNVEGAGVEKEQRPAKRDTKNEILLAAVELFAEKGYRETSMRDIAKSAGIRPASIYNHYASKELIMETLLEFYLERMEYFYKYLNEVTLYVTEGKDLETVLQQLMLSYEPDEKLLMYQLTRIVHHEQFHFEQAAEALIGEGYRKYMLAHAAFFDRLSDAGLITGKENNRMYAELFARISLTFATQFLHPNIEATLPDQSALYPFVIKLVANYENNRAAQRPAGQTPETPA